MDRGDGKVSFISNGMLVAQDVIMKVAEAGPGG